MAATPDFDPFRIFRALGAAAPAVNPDTGEADPTAAPDTGVNPAAFDILAALRNPAENLGLRADGPAPTQALAAAAPGLAQRPTNPTAPPAPPTPPTRDQLLHDPAAFQAAGGVVSQGHEASQRDLSTLAGAAEGSKADANVGKVEANFDLANRKAEMDKKVAEHIALQAETFHETYTKFAKEAEDDNKDFVAQLKAAKESRIDPHRYWNNSSNFSKAMWILSFAAAGFQKGSHLLPTVMAALQNAINNDIGAQKADQDNTADNLAKQADALKEKRGNQAATLKNLAIEQANRLEGLSKGLQADIDKYGAQWAHDNGIMEIKANVDAEALKVQTTFQAQNIQLAKEKADRAFARSERLAREAHDREMAQLAQSYKIADEKRAAETASAKPTAALNPAMGVKMIGPDGKTQIRFNIPGEGDAQFNRAKEANQLVETANKRYTSLLQLQEHMPQTVADLIRGGDVEFRAALLELGYYTAQANGNKIVTDKDFKAGVQQVLGINVDSLTGAVLDYTKTVGEVQPQVKERVDSQIRNLTKTTEQSLNAYANPDEIGQGAKVVYEPQDLRVGKAAPDDLDTAALKLGGGGVTPDMLPERKRQPVSEGGQLTGNYVVHRVGETPEEAAKADAEFAVRQAISEGTRAGQHAEYAAEMAGALKTYWTDKKQDRLPPLDPEDKAIVEKALAEFQNRGDKAIMTIIEAVGKNPNVSSEAKMRVIAEGARAKSGTTPDAWYKAIARYGILGQELSEADIEAIAEALRVRSNESVK